LRKKLADHQARIHTTEEAIMSGHETDLTMIESAIEYSKNALSLLYETTGLFELDDGGIKKKPGYPTSEGIAHFIVLKGGLALTGIPVRRFTSKLQFLEIKGKTKPSLLEIKFDNVPGTLQFFFTPEREGDSVRYQVWKSNYAKNRDEQNKTG